MSTAIEQRENLRRIIIVRGLTCGTSAVLASGQTSDVYVNMRNVANHGPAALLIAQNLQILLMESGIKKATHLQIGAIAGGGIVPASHLIGYRTTCLNKPTDAAIIHKQAKTHGASTLVDNYTLGTPIVLLEDTLTTGGSAMRAATALREHDPYAHILGLMALVDREEGAREACAQNKIRYLGAVFTLAELQQPLDSSPPAR